MVYVLPMRSPMFSPRRLPILLLLAALAFPPVAAADGRARITLGKLHIGPEQKLMLEASKKAMERDFRSAEALYSQAIAINPSSVRAYLQRGTVRREMGDVQGSARDAQQAASLAEANLSRDPGKGKWYYFRGSAYRLLRRYDLARADIEQALRLDPDESGWRTDLLAIALEEKMQP